MNTEQIRELAGDEAQQYLQERMMFPKAKDFDSMFPEGLVDTFRALTRSAQSAPISVVLPDRTSELFKPSRELREHSDNTWLWINSPVREPEDLKVKIEERTFSNLTWRPIAWRHAVSRVQRVKPHASRNKREGAYAGCREGRHYRTRLSLDLVKPNALAVSRVISNYYT